MENTLQDVLTNIPNSGSVPSFNAYLTTLSIGLSYRFPFVTELNTIPAVEVQQVADFSYACVAIAMERWTALQTGGGETAAQQQRASGSILRQAKAS